MRNWIAYRIQKYKGHVLARERNPNNRWLICHVHLFWCFDFRVCFAAVWSFGGYLNGGGNQWQAVASFRLHWMLSWVRPVRIRQHATTMNDRWTCAFWEVVFCCCFFVCVDFVRSCTIYQLLWFDTFGTRSVHNLLLMMCVSVGCCRFKWWCLTGEVR